MNLVFVGGVHGVGKTTFCKSIIDKTSFTHSTASQLIKEAKSSLISENIKAVENIASNQEILIHALKKYHQFKSNKDLLLDGHFTLISSQGKIEKIDIEVFVTISPKLIIVLHDEPKKIASRRLNRDGSKITADEINFHQVLELEHAEKVAKTLDIQFIKLSPDNISIIQCVALLKNI